MESLACAFFWRDEIGLSFARLRHKTTLAHSLARSAGEGNSSSVLIALVPWRPWQRVETPYTHTLISHKPQPFSHHVYSSITVCKTFQFHVSSH